MRKLVILFAAVLSALVGYAQSGSEVLGAMADKIGSMDAYQIDFELEMPTATDSSKGSCKVWGERYVIAIDDMKQGSDGSVVWTLIGANQEVTLDNPHPQSRSLFDNPTKAFDFAEELFEVEWMESFDNDSRWRLVMLPSQGVLDGVERVVLEVDNKSNLPTRLGYDMAGMGLWIKVLSIKPIKPTEEMFAVERPDGYEVVDFR